MTASPASVSSAENWMPSTRRLLITAFLMILLSGAVSALNWNGLRFGGVTVLWASNGLLLGILLIAPRRQWPVYLTLGLVIDVLASIAVGNGIPISAYLASCNILEVGLAASLLHRPLITAPVVLGRRALFYFLGYGVILAPAVASLLASIYPSHPLSLATLYTFRRWFIADALGIAIVTPVYLSFQMHSRFAGRSRREIALLFALLIVAVTLIFRQTHYPLLFLILPVLMALGVRLRLAGSALGLLVVSIIGEWFTETGRGPLGLTPGSTLPARVLLLQFFLATCMVVLYVMEARIAERDQLQADVEESESRFRLLAEVSRDIIVLSGLDGARKYVSPAVTEALGWLPSELVDHNYLQIVHPDDTPMVEELLNACRKGSPSATLAYRCLKRDGGYLWMESNLRLYRDPRNGEPVGFVNIVRDISSRKLAEEELQKAFLLVEELAGSDALTGIANRRRLDTILDNEWRRAARDRLPLSLLLMDVDHFKLYNDIYGHVHGDACLRQIAAIAQKVVHRPGDLLARYGGEEFAVVMPSTDAHGAQLIAEQIRLDVLALALSHEGNPHGVVTISIGCATTIPDCVSGHELLVEAADQALYRAKASGRNRFEFDPELHQVSKSASGSRLVFRDSPQL